MDNTIVLGGGCFWCLDATYKLVKGINEVEEGYSGGNIPNPTDEQIYYENTGHAEVVRLTYDPKVISLQTIFEIFFIIHDPTTLNRQGPDVGSEYRSIVLYKTKEEKEVIEQAIKDAGKLWEDKIVTEVVKFKDFYPADEHHKDYERLRPDYCQVIINPKLAKLRANFAKYLK